MVRDSHKPKGVPLLAIMVGTGVLALALYLVVFPCCVTATSPDGRFTVKVTYPNYWWPLRDSPETNVVRIHLVDNTTTQQIQVQVDRAGAAGLTSPGELPDEVLWKADSKSFLYIYYLYSPKVVPTVDAVAYDVAVHPFKVLRARGPSWVKPMLEDRFKAGRAHDCEGALLGEIYHEITEFS